VSAVNPPTFYRDRDGDEQGDPAATRADHCAPPAGWVADARDCNDFTARVHREAPERCDGQDNDCDGAVDEGACPADCTGRARGNQGYLFCRTHRSWTEAAAVCAAEAMTLVRIDDQAENDWVFHTAHEVLPSGWDDLWIGASDRGTEGVWVWPDGTQFWQGRSDGSAVGGRYADGKRGEPNDYNGEDCAEMEDYHQDGKLWNDVPCSLGHEYVCEW
jgi:hypothetical protein